MTVDVQGIISDPRLPVLEKLMGNSSGSPTMLGSSEAS